MATRDITPDRHVAEAELLHRALEGDVQAANRALQYLSSNDHNLRRLMQETLYDVNDSRVWRHLLRCLALRRWGDQQDCDRRSDPLASQRIDRSIVEVFIEDAGETDKLAKETILRNGLDDPEMHIRQACAYLLGMRGELEAIPQLAETIETGDLQWQLRAIEALVALKDERCGPPLVRALAMDRDQLHHAAQRALGELGSLAVPAWMQALGNSNSHIRWHAARGLGEVGDARSVQLLAEGLYDENHAVRWASARVLARLDAVAVPAILTVLSRQKLTEPFRQAVYHALHSMVSTRTQERLRPLLHALHGAAANVEAPAVAQRLLATW